MKPSVFVVAAALLLCAASPGFALEKNGEAFTIQSGMDSVFPTRSGSILFETRSGDIAVYFTNSIVTQTGAEEELYFKLLNGDGSRKWRKTLVQRADDSNGVVVPLYASGAIELADGGFLLGYGLEKPGKSTGYYVRKVAGGVRVGKPKAVVTAELGQPYRPDRINSDLIQTPTGGAAVWSLYRSGGGEAKTGINFISNTGEVSFPSLDISKRRKTAWEFLSSMTDSASYSCGPTSENEVSSLGFLIGMARLSASR